MVRDRRIEPAPHIWWLGIWLDTQLNFKQHIQEWTGKANRLVHFLRHINGVHRGAASGPLIREVHAYILSTALHGAEAWWLGLTRITSLRDKEVGTRVGWHISLLDKTIMKAIRVPLPIALSMWSGSNPGIHHPPAKDATISSSHTKNGCLASSSPSSG